MGKLPPNGHTVRTFDLRGHSISEVNFIVEDLGPCLGYCVGANDGYSTLYSTAEEAIARHPFARSPEREDGTT